MFWQLDHLEIEILMFLFSLASIQNHWKLPI